MFTEPEAVAAKLPAQPSVAVAPGSRKLVWHSTVIGFGPFTVMVGATVSTIVISTSSSSDPPPEDVTVRVIVCGPVGSETLSVAPEPRTAAPSFHE